MIYSIKIFGIVSFLAVVSFIYLAPYSVAAKPAVEADSKVAKGAKVAGHSANPSMVGKGVSQPTSTKQPQKGTKPPAKTSVTSPKQATIKLKNVKLVVEDVDNSVGERLVPVDPVVLRQKPKTVPIVEGKREKLVLPHLGNQAKSQGGDQSLDSDTEQKPILIVSKIQEEEVPTVGIGARGYSPFHPPAPGTFPSTLSDRELVNAGGSGSLGSGSELLPLPPVSNVGGLSNLDPSLPPLQGGIGNASPGLRVARAVPVTPSPGSQVGQPFGQTPWGATKAAPSMTSYYTDSESSALLHMATESKGFEGPSSSVFGKLW